MTESSALGAAMVAGRAVGVDGWCCSKTTSVSATSAETFLPSITSIGLLSLIVSAVERGP